MFTFIVSAICLAILCVVVMVRPLMKGAASDSYTRHLQNIHFAKERLAELDEQLAQATISSEDYEALKQEIESTLATDIDLSEQAQKDESAEANNKTSNAIAITLLCCLLPVTAVATYLITGTPSAIGATATVADQAQPAASQSEQLEQINGLIGGLQERLKNAPDDAEGWTILARTYQQLGRFQESVDAYKKLLALKPNSPDVYAGLADASGLLADGRLPGEPLSYVQKALELDPNHPQALWLSGLGEVQLGNPRLAIQKWETLLPLLAEFPQQEMELRDVIAQTKEAAGISSEPGDNASSRDSAPATGKAITINVSIDESVAANISASDMVFVLARAANGPPAPLAVKRMRASDFPTQIVLSEADAMMPQLTIGAFEQLEVIARVSKSGNPIAQSGDYESQVLTTSNTNSEILSLTISKQVQ